MRFRIAVVVAFAGALLVTPVAAAHVTLNPREWEAGGFGRFAVRVPNERPDASTTEVTVELPEGLNFVSFQPVPGWTRTVEMETLDEPIEGEEGEEPITERIASVTWAGGEIGPGEFQEFGLSFQVPEEATEPLLFPSLQTYSSGEVVRWIEPTEDADLPAPQVAVLAAAQEEEPAETTTEPSATVTGETTEVPESQAAAGSDDGDDGGRATLALVFGILGLAAGLAALGIALTRGRRAPEGPA